MKIQIARFLAMYNNRLLSFVVAHDGLAWACGFNSHIYAKCLVPRNLVALLQKSVICEAIIARNKAGTRGLRRSILDPTL
jgi:hypothetical protein